MKLVACVKTTPDTTATVNVENGKPAWGGRAVAFPEGGMPSGRGFMSGGR